MGVCSAILGIGQIGGPIAHGTSGMWSKHGWFPSLIMSATYMDMLPNDLGFAINWVPVDICARILLDLGGYIMTQAARQEHEEGGIAYFYVVNPYRTHWWIGTWYPRGL
jgi:hypothetical protein